MRPNFGRNKRKIEEAKKARREEKRNKKLIKGPEDSPAPEAPAPPPETPPAA